MKLYNEEDPNDDVETRETKKWRRAQLALMKRYQESLTAAGLKAPFSLKEDFDEAANDNDSICFLTKLISKVSEINDAQFSVIYDDHFTIEYIPPKGNYSEALIVTDLDMDYLSKNAVDAQLAVMEKVKSAMLLAHSAKAAGWTKVNFQDTTDPLSRYLLAIACKDIGIDTSSEKVDIEAIPDIMIKEDKLVDLAYSYFNQIKENPFMSVAERKHAGKNNANNDNDDNSLNFEIA
jgi:hypothetical protein